MLIRIELLGDPAIYVGDQSKTLPMRTLGRILVYLCLNAGKKISRHDVAAEVWPGEDFSVSGNRLRISIKRLREILGDFLQADRESVGIFGADINIDVDEIEAQLKRIFDEVDGDVELKHLREVIKRTGELISDDLQFAELDIRRLQWSSLCLRAARRMTELALKGDSLEDVEIAFLSGRIHSTLDRVLWENYLRALNREGNIDRGLRELRNLASRVDDDDLDQISELRQFGENLKKVLGSESAKLDMARTMDFGQTFLRVLVESPEVMGEVLIIPEVERQWSRRSPEMVGVLEEIMNCLQAGSNLWVEIGIRRLAELAALYAAFDQIKLCTEMLKFDMKPNQRSRVLYYLGFSNFQVRNWDDALKYVRETQETAESMGDAQSGDSAKIAEASILWHLGQTELAQRYYLEYIEMKVGSDSIVHRLNTSVCHANLALVEIFFGTMAQARHYIDKCYLNVTAEEIDPLLPMLLPIFAFVDRAEGKVKKGADLLVDGMRRTFARGAYREGQCILDIAAGFLALEGRAAEAQAVFDWVEHWREETSHQRSIAELKFVEDCMIVQKRIRGVRFDPNEAYRNVMAFTIQQLRDIQAKSSS